MYIELDMAVPVQRADYRLATTASRVSRACDIASLPLRSAHCAPRSVGCAYRAMLRGRFVAMGNAVPQTSSAAICGFLGPAIGIGSATSYLNRQAAGSAASKFWHPAGTKISPPQRSTLISKMFSQVPGEDFTNGPRAGHGPLATQFKASDFFVDVFKGLTLGYQY